MVEAIRDCFVTGKWGKDEDAAQLLARATEDDDVLYGDFEDLEKELKEEEQAAKEQDAKEQVPQKRATDREERIKQIEQKRLEFLDWKPARFLRVAETRNHFFRRSLNISMYAQ